MRQTVTRSEIVAAARRFVGTPFLHQGRNPAVGLDCVGQLIAVRAMLELRHYDSLDYRQSGMHRRTLERHIAEVGIRYEDIAQARPGDVWLIRPNHVVIVTERNPFRIIEATDEYGVTERGFASERIQLIYAMFRFPEVRDGA